MLMGKWVGGCAFLFSTLGFGLAATPAQALEAPKFLTHRYPFLFGPFQKLDSGQPWAKAQHAQLLVEQQPEIRALLQAEPGRQLALIQGAEYEGVQTYKFQDFVEGIEVLGSQALQHEGPAGMQVSHSMEPVQITLVPSLTTGEIGVLAQTLGSNRPLEAEPELKILPGKEGQAARLIYLARLGAAKGKPAVDLLIHAHSGQIIAELDRIRDVHGPADATKKPSTPSSSRGGKKAVPPTDAPSKKPVQAKLKIAPIDILGANDECQQVGFGGMPEKLLLRSCDKLIVNGKLQKKADIAAKQALLNSQKTLEYYLSKHKRDSFNGKGAKLISVVHAGDGMNNAFWDPENHFMAYGDGDGETFRSFTQATDVAGHEMTHGIASDTAKFTGMGESGALDEAYADFFGKLISGEDSWALGKTLYIDPKAPGIRNLKNPNAILTRFKDEKTGKFKPYPAKASEMIAFQEPCNRSNDGCGVHVNSTVISHAGYQMVQRLGQAKAEKLNYLVLTQYLSSGADFKKARNATIDACAQLYSTADCELVKDAWAAVGL